MVKIQELYDVIFHTAFEGFRVRHQKQTAKPARNRSYKEWTAAKYHKKVVNDQMNEIRENLF